MTKHELIEKLAGSVGVEKATAAVDECCAALNITSEPWSYADSLAVLERLAEDEGLIGTVARFAKVRVILSGPPTPGLGMPPVKGKRDPSK